MNFGFDNLGDLTCFDSTMLSTVEEEDSSMFIPATPPPKTRPKSDAQVRREKVRQKRLQDKNRSSGSDSSKTSRNNSTKSSLNSSFKIGGLKKSGTYRTYVLKNGNKIKIYKSLKKDKTIKKFRIKSDTQNDFVLERLHKNITLLENVIFQQLTDCHIWEAINKAILDLLPDHSSSGLRKCQSTDMWKAFKRNLSRTSKAGNLGRLSLVLQHLGNELPALADACNKIIKKIFDELFFVGIEPFTPHSACHRSVLDFKPPKFAKRGDFYEMLN